MPDAEDRYWNPTASVPIPTEGRVSRWVLLSIGVGAIILLVRLRVSTASIEQRLLRDLTLYVVLPLGLGAAYGRRIGWTVDRRALLDTIFLAAFVTPFYVVGSTIPTVRAFYSMWTISATLGEFVPHAIQLFLLALAAETYYRGLLCVGIREIGYTSVFVSPIVYAMMHTGKPPIEFLLSAPTDVLFGAADYRSGSILPSTVAHGLGLVLLDWLVLHDPLLPVDSVLRWLGRLPVPL
ncbi:MAG: CPBP family intramembrane glutamic endopeptidase [Natronomonas sp.]